MSNLIFKNWKPRCSELGRLMTNLPKEFSEDDRKQLTELLKEKRSGINANGSNTKWTVTKQSQVDKLFKAKRNNDVLPVGAISYLDEVFNEIFFKRKEVIHNEYLEKGTLTENAIFRLYSKVKGEKYLKSAQVEVKHEYLTTKGWDWYLNNLVLDTKSNYNLKSFQEADLKSIYDWQLKGYSWVIKDYYKLDFYPQGKLVYGLVNNPIHQLKNKIQSTWYYMGQPDHDDTKWTLTRKQIERNYIFDIEEWRLDYPDYEWENEILDFHIPHNYRIKEFDVSVCDDDIQHIKRRVLMARIYLCNKEIEEINKFN